MKQIYPPRVMKPLRFPLKRLTFFLFFFLLLAAGVRGQCICDPPPDPVNLTVPLDYTGTTCMPQTDVDAAYAAFVGGASFTGGCGGVLTNNAPGTPDFCGGQVSVTWTVTSSCEVPVSLTRTFTIPSPAAVELTVPANYTGTTCMTQAAVNEAYTTFVNGASFIGGCGGVLTNNAPATPDFCGGQVSVTWTVTSSCEVPVSLTRTFTIPSPAAVELTVPANYTGTTCMTQAEVATAYTTFVNGASFIGGCGGVLTNNAPATPDFCGGQVSVTWTVTSSCEVPVSLTRTFTIPSPAAVELTVPDNYMGTTCMTQADVDAAYAVFVSGGSLIGGCNAQISNDAPLAAPSRCGGSTTVTWTVTDQCYATTTHAAIFTISASPVITLTVPQAELITVPEGCLSQADINGYFNDWLNKVSVEGGCDPVVVTSSTSVAPGNCGSVTVIWTAFDGCSVQTANSTFTVENLIPTPLNYIVPDDVLVPYQTQEDINGAFAIWLSGFEANGGCGNILYSTDPITPQPPNLPCGGGSTTVIFTVTTDCEVISETRTFSVDYTSMLYDNIVTEENPNAPLVDYYDDRNTAYISNGVSGSEGDLVHWLDASWTRCLQDGVNIGYPNNNSSTPEPVANNKSQLYIQISLGDYIYVEKVSYQNNITIVVCGYLEIGEFSVDEDDEDQGAFLNNVNIVICEGGFLKAKVLELKNTVTIYNFGTLQAGLITGQGSASTQCIQGTGNFQDLDGNTIIYNDPVDNQWYVNDDYLTLVDPDSHLGWTFGEGCVSPGVLPVELLSFVSQTKPDRINLLWTTGSEINNDYFTLERSRDLSGWEVLGFVPGAGNSSLPLSYSFSDLQPLDGLAYYRLKQTDFDGKFKYYGPIAAHYDLGLAGLDFKVIKQYTNWIIAVPQDGIYQVEVYTLTGRRIISQKVENNLSIPAPEGGVVIRVTDGFARSASRVVM